MAWNEPGKGKDPESGNNRNSGNKGGNEGPPDLEQVWKRLRERFGQGGRGSRQGKNGGNGGGFSSLVFALIPVAIVIWLATGLYVIQPGEKGVTLRLGQYVETVQPGWHWRLPYPITRVLRVDTQQVRRTGNRAVMLTKDENIVDVEVSVQYRITDPMHYLFQLQDPDNTVDQVLRSAVREIVGTSNMNQVIQEGMDVNDVKDQTLSNVNMKENSGKPRKKDGLRDIDKNLVSEIKEKQKEYPEITSRSRAKLPENVLKIMQYTLDQYDSGIELLAVNVQYAQPPEEVQSAFHDAIKAREEEERAKNLARAYARDILARVKGDKAEMMARARAYKQRKIEHASGEAARFAALLDAYRKAPDVTRKRLYLETMGEVLSASNLIINDGASDSLTYLPLDKVLEKDSKSSKSSSDDKSSRDHDEADESHDHEEQSSSDDDAQPSVNHLRSRSRDS